MLTFTLLLLIQFWTTVKSECGAPPSVTLSCGQNQINASWNSGNCKHYQCKGYLNCTNGTGLPYLFETHDGTCNSIMNFSNIPLDYYYCSVAVYYRYFDDNDNFRKSPDTKETCTYNKIEIQDNYSKNPIVGNYHEVNCQIYTGKTVNSSEMNISWTGLNGVLASESDRITVNSTTSDGHIHTSTLQFSYINEGDENTTYNCIASLSEENETLSESFTMTNLTIPKPTITLNSTGNQTVGDELSLRCVVSLPKGISGSLNFVWKINNTDQTAKIPFNDTSVSLSNTSTLYTDFLNISSLNLTDSNTVYQCQAEIVTSHSVNLTVSSYLTLNVTETSSTSSNSQVTATPTPQSSHTAPPSPSAAPPVNSHVALVVIILSAVLIFALIGLIIGIFVSCHQKWKSLLLNVFKRARKDCSREEYQIRMPDIDDNDYSVIGKDDPSTVEYLKYDRIARSNADAQMPKIDEECNSIASLSDFLTNEEMLTRVYGNSASRKQHFKAIKLDNGYYSDTSMSPKKDVPGTLNDDANHLHSDLSGDYVESSPYVDDTVALHQQNPLSCIDPPYTSLSQMEDPLMVPSDSGDNPPTQANEGEYGADGMMIEQCGSPIDVISVDLGYLDYNAAFNQNNAKQTVPYLPVAGASMISNKPSSDCNSFPYVKLNEDSLSSIPSDQFISRFSSKTHGETREINDSSSYLHTATVAGTQATEDANVNPSFTAQQSGTEQMINVANQTLLHKTTTNSSIEFEYMEENNDDSYISEQ